MPRTIPTTSYTTRTEPTILYENPRYVVGTALCDIITDLLHDITGSQLVTSDPNAEEAPLINTIYT